MDKPYILMNPLKSMVAGILLPLFLGPIGVLYVSVLWSLILTVIAVVLTLSPMNSFLSIASMLFIWLISLFLTAALTSRYNRKILSYHMPEMFAVCVDEDEEDEDEDDEEDDEEEDKSDEEEK